RACVSTPRCASSPLPLHDALPIWASIYASMTADIEAFVQAEGYDFENQFVFERVALTQAQVTQFRLPTAPPKKSDTRSNNWVGQDRKSTRLNSSDQITSYAVSCIQ